MITYEISDQEKNLIKSEILKFSHLEINKKNIIDVKNFFKSKFPKLADLKNELENNSGYIKIKSLPIGDSTAYSTPNNGKRPLGKSNFSEFVLLGVTSSFDLNPFSYFNEKNGDLVHEIAPIKGMEKSISSNGVDDFNFHTDGAYLNREIRPHALSLLCITNKANTPTNIVSLNQCIKSLSPKDLDLLSQKLFIHYAPETFNVDKKVSYSSIIDRVNGDFEIKGAMHNTKALTKNAEISLKNLISLINKNTIANQWKSGELLIFSNLKTLHGRGKISGERWLQRCYSSYNHQVADIITL